MTDTTLDRRPPPHADLLRGLGATLGPFEGAERPLHYGDPEAEYRALATGCGFLVRSWVERVDLTGSDRARFLQGLVTCEVKGLETGGGAYGFFTDVKGRVLADLALRVEEGRLALALPPERWAGGLEEHVRRYLVADRVELARVEGFVVVTIAGPGAGAALTGLGVEPPAAPWSHGRASPGRVEAVVWNRRLDGEAVFDLELPAHTAEPLVRRLRAAAARPVGEEVWRRRRIERLVPRFGVDFGPDHLPQETGLEEAISYTKGCYLGQEVVARIHYRGKVNRSVCGLVFPATPPAAGTAVLDGGKEMGRVTSVAPALRARRSAGRAIGLAILHRRVGDPGTRVELAGGGVATVVAGF